MYYGEQSDASTTTHSEGTERVDGTAATFGVWRRNWIERILLDKTLEPKVRLVAFAIAGFLNRDSRSTYAGDAAIARKIGLSVALVRRAIQCLIKAGHLKTQHRGAVRYLFPVVPDHPMPTMRLGRGKRFLEWCGAWLDAVFYDTTLTPACRIAALAITMHTDGETRTSAAGYDELAEIVGLSRKTLQRAIRSLWEADHIEVSAEGNHCPLVIRLVFQREGGLEDGLEGGLSERGSPATSTNCTDNPSDIRDPSNIQSPSDSAPFGRTVRAKMASSCDFEACDIVATYGDGMMHIGGVIACAEYLERTMTFADIAAAIRAGFLRRVDRDGTPNRNGRYVVLIEDTFDNEAPTRQAA